VANRVDDEHREPRLTIGMPVYNNARTIKRALESLLGQTYRGFQLIISDDGSTDGTTDVCEAYAAQDSRITVVRQPRNLNYGNFRYVLQRADTPLFMFAAGDDWWHETYVARAIQALDSDARAVCAVSRVAFVKDDEIVAEARGTRPLVADPAANVVRFLNANDDNSRMYGIFRTDVAQRAFPDRDFFGYDWAFSVGTLLEGIHIEVPELLLWRDYTVPARYIDYVRRDTRHLVARLFPMLPMTRDLVSRLQLPVSARLIATLAQVNMRFHVAYMRRYHPRAATISETILACVAFGSRALGRLRA